MRRAARVDDNQPDIVRKLRQIPGVTVCILSAVGKGVPDILIGWKGANYLIEIKDGNKPPSAQKLTPDEKNWHDNWTGQKAVCNSFEAVLAVIYAGNPPF